MAELTKGESKLIEQLVKQAEAAKPVFTTLLSNLFTTFASDAELMKYVHSMKWRVKDPAHLRDKLVRKLKEAKAAGRKYAITPENLLVKVNDLAGLRILHLHTRQFEDINRCLARIFDDQMYRVLEGPSARTWDDESRDYFQSINTKYVKIPLSKTISASRLSTAQPIDS
jgi:ppGpp synthetase/RelA/SpoT-type nucleotidyltranferase